MTGAARRDLDGRTVVWGPGALAAADDLVGDGYALLTTARALGMEPRLAALAADVVIVPDGPVGDVAGDLRDAVRGRRLVAFGGGRVVDTAKALAAADAPRTVLAIPTTLSGAEMTRMHRHARGVPGEAPRVRPNAVVNDPELSASAPEPALAASSANALGHALTAFAADAATPDIAATASAAVRMIAGGWARERPDRPALALGAMLAGAAIGRIGLGLHHALAQTAARTAGLRHSAANAAMLPASATALAWRAPDGFASLATATGVEALTIARVLRARADVDEDAGLLGADEAVAEMAGAVLDRPEIGRTAPPPSREEVEALYAAAAEPGGLPS